MTAFHLAMLTFAVTVTGYLIAKRAWFPAICAGISQIPFWGGFVAAKLTQESPILINLLVDMTTAAVFVWLLHTFNEKWLAWCGMLFVTAGFVDVYAGLFGMSHYLLAHEIIHYLALLVIVGREYVERWDSYMVAGIGRLSRSLADR